MRGSEAAEAPPRVGGRVLQIITPGLSVQPLENLLNRIRWDAEFAKGTFAIGYLDRIAGGEQVVLFGSIRFAPEHPGSFTIEDEDGVARHIPLHRVRTVYRDGIVIWRRANL